jgi:threonine/homoserine/homoserine lactone efflux protein
VNWIDAELLLVSLAAMLSPTTLTFSTLVLVLSERPFRTGSWFYLGALGATLAIGVVAAFVLGDAAASSHPSTPKTWVAIMDLVAAGLLLAFVVRAMRRPRDSERAAETLQRMEKVTASRAIAIVGAGAVLANPGGFIPLALKEISELDPSHAEYVADWVFFSLVSLLPLATALLLLVVAREWTRRTLESARRWLELNARTIAAVILVALAAVLARNGIAGLTA